MTIMEHETTVQPELDIEVGNWRMDPSLKQRWVTALRSGKYEQTAGVFYYQGAYCALGVLLDVAGKMDELEKWDFLWSTLGESGADAVYTRNDGGVRFPELADYIEENY